MRKSIATAIFGTLVLSLTLAGISVLMISTVLAVGGSVVGDSARNAFNWQLSYLVFAWSFPYFIAMVGGTLAGEEKLPRSYAFGFGAVASAFGLILQLSSVQLFGFGIVGTTIVSLIYSAVMPAVAFKEWSKPKR